MFVMALTVVVRLHLTLTPAQVKLQSVVESRFER